MRGDDNTWAYYACQSRRCRGGITLQKISGRPTGDHNQNPGTAWYRCEDCGGRNEEARVAPTKAEECGVES